MASGGPQIERLHAHGHSYAAQRQSQIKKEQGIHQSKKKAWTEVWDCHPHRPHLKGVTRANGPTSHTRRRPPHAPLPYLVDAGEGHRTFVQLPVRRRWGLLLWVDRGSAGSGAGSHAWSSGGGDMLVREAPPDLVQAAAQASSAQGMAPASNPSSGRCGGRCFGAVDGGDSGVGSSESLGQQVCFFLLFGIWLRGVEEEPGGWEGFQVATFLARDSDISLLIRSSLGRDDIFRRTLYSWRTLRRHLLSLQKFRLQFLCQQGNADR